MYCPNCNQEHDGKFCPECGTKLVEKPEAKINFNLGDANAISGGVHLTDSHNVHNEDKSVHNITNTTSTVNNVTNVAAQKTEYELQQELKTTYLNACKRAYEDNVLEQHDVLVLEELRIKLNLDKSTANAILDSVRRLSERNARKSTLNPIAKTKLKILTNNLQKNEVKALMDQIDSLEPLVRKFDYDELSRKYFLVLAALKSERCIELYETSMVDSYWKSFWSYLAYIKQGQLAKAENVLISLDRFTEYPEDNMNVLAVAGALMTGNTFEANEYLCELVGEYTPALQRFVDSLYLLLDPNMAKEMGADENTCAFYLVNFFGQKDPKAKAEEERLRQEAEKQAEAKRKAEEERKAMEEARNHVTYTLKLVKVTNKTLATFTMRAIMGWDAGKSTDAFNSLPQAVKTTDDLEEAKDLYKKLKKGGMTVAVEAMNGLNEKEDVKLGHETPYSELPMDKIRAAANASYPKESYKALAVAALKIAETIQERDPDAEDPDYPTLDEAEVAYMVHPSEFDPNVNKNAFPVHFLFMKDGAPKVAVVAVTSNGYRTTHVKETEEACKNNNIGYIRVFADGSFADWINGGLFGYSEITGEPVTEETIRFCKDWLVGKINDYLRNV